MTKRNKIAKKNCVALVVLYMVLMFNFINIFADDPSYVVKEVIAASNTTYFLMEDGKVFYCGDAGITPVPTLLEGINEIVDIKAGFSHVLALDKNGYVWAWGNNDAGQLGNGTEIYSSLPVKVKELEGIKAIGCGDSCSLAIKNDGSVWIWGHTFLENNMPKSLVPVKVPGIDNAISVSANSREGIGVILKSDGSVWTWGDNHNGILGDGTTEYRNSPVQLKELSDIIAISSSSTHSLALKKNGTVWAWGSDDAKLIVNKAYNKVPCLVGGIDKITLHNMYRGKEDEPSRTTFNKVVKISTNDRYSLVVKEDGTVWEWGAYTLYSFTKIENLTGVISASAGPKHAVALKNDNNLYAWGFNEYGQLGDGTLQKRELPVRVSNFVLPNPSIVVQNDAINNTRIATDGYIGLTIKQDGTVWSWGKDAQQLLGNDYHGKIEGLVKAEGFNNIVSVTRSSSHSAALKNDGSVWFWGNYLNQSGPQKPFQYKAIDNVIAIASSNRLYYTVFLKNDGTVWELGKIGNNPDDYVDLPAKKDGISNIKFIQCNGNYTVAIDNNNIAWYWGLYEKAPIQIEATDVKSLVIGREFFVVLKNSGEVWTWGKNNSGQLGDGTTVSRERAVKVNGISNVVAVAVDWNTTLALKDNGTIWKWGGYDPKDTISKNDNHPYPVQMKGISDIIAIASSTDPIGPKLALKRDGTAWKWGYEHQKNGGGGPIKFGPLDGSDYTTSSNSSEIVLFIENPKMIVNGTQKEIDPGKGTSPIIIKGRTLIPIRALVEALGGTVEWNNNDKKVTIIMDSKKIELFINKASSLINGKEVRIDESPKIIKERTMIPLRYVIENLGRNVEWDDTQKKITIK